MMEVVTDFLLKVLIPLLGAIVTYVLVPYIKTKTKEAKREDIIFWLKVGINKAERAYKEQEGKKGAYKKLFVLDFMNERGYKMSVDDLDVLIDEYVDLLFNGGEKDEAYN